MIYFIHFIYQMIVSLSEELCILLYVLYLCIMLFCDKYTYTTLEM